MADLSAIEASIEASEVHVWHAILDQAADRSSGPLAADMANLTGAERARCLKLSRPADQRRFAAVHAGVRQVLAAYLDTAAPLIRLGRVPCCRCGDTGHGPPRIDWPRTDITFSLSHAGSHWLLAVARGRRVGADIEVTKGTAITGLARDCLSPAELVYLKSQRRGRRDDVVYTCWTRKEAVLKACGIGLAVPPGSVEVAPMRTPRARVRLACAAGVREWLVEDLASYEDALEPPGPDGQARWFGAIAQPLTDSGPILPRDVPAVYARARAPDEQARR